jgi:cytochrome c nitrite reductase small subunit
MREEYDGWLKASHHTVAVCNDCHLPHESLIGKLFVKASNGYHHSTAFTFQNFHEPTRIKPSNSAVLEANCIRCHQQITSAITEHGTLGQTADPAIGPDLFGCVRCHASVGHGPTR